MEFILDGLNYFSNSRQFEVRLFVEIEIEVEVNGVRLMVRSLEKDYIINFGGFDRQLIGY